MSKRKVEGWKGEGREQGGGSRKGVGVQQRNRILVPEPLPLHSPLFCSKPQTKVFPLCILATVSTAVTKQLDKSNLREKGSFWPPVCGYSLSW